MFSITPDRASIHKDEDSTVSENTETKRGARWNKWIFQELVVHAWIGNLQYIHDLTLKKQCTYSGWSLWPVGSQNQGEHSIHGSAVLGLVFEKIVLEKRMLLPAISDSTAYASEVLFAGTLEEPLKNALRDAGVAVICPPTDRTAEVYRTLTPAMGINCVSPRTVRAALTALDGSLQSIGASSRSVLLDYILTDRDYGDLERCTAPLIPLVDGSYGSFQRSSIEYRLNTGMEPKLFADCKAFSIDNSKLSNDTYRLFVNSIDYFQTFTNVWPWDIPGARWYLITYIFSTGSSKEEYPNDVVTRPGLTGWIDQFWKWAILKDRENIVSAVEDLWLVPLSGGRFRKLSQSRPALDISGRREVAQLFKEITSSPTATTNYPIYSGTLSQEVSDFFHHAGLIADCGRFEKLVTWLGNYPSFLETATKEQRSQLVFQLGRMSTAARYQTMSSIQKTRIQPMVQMLRNLPLYHEAFIGRQERQVIPSK